MTPSTERIGATCFSIGEKQRVADRFAFFTNYRSKHGMKVQKLFATLLRAGEERQQHGRGPSPQHRGGKMKLQILNGSRITAAVLILASAQSAFSQDICSDAYMSEQIQPYASRAQNTTGVCDSAKATIALLEASIDLINPCLGDPNLAAYKVQLEDSLRDARSTAAGSCG